MGSKPDSRRDGWMLTDRLASGGVQRWRFVFPAIRDDTRDRCCIFIEYYACTEPSWRNKPGDKAESRAGKRTEGTTIRPAYFAVHAGIWGSGAVQYTHVFDEGEAEILQGPPFTAKAGECLFTEFETYGSIPREDDPARQGYNGAGSSGKMQTNRHHPYQGNVYGSGIDAQDFELADDTAIEWDIEFDKKISYNAGVSSSPFSRKIHASDAYWHAEGLVTEYTGTIIIGDVSYRTFPDAGSGYADVTWGSGFPSPGLWLWTTDLADSSGIPRTGDVLAAWGGHIRMNVPSSPDEKFFGALLTGKRRYDFNSMKSALTGSTSLKTEETEDTWAWHLILSGEKAMIDARITCRKDSMIRDELPSPLNRLQTYQRFTGADGEGKILLFVRSGLFGSYEKRDEMTARHIVCAYGCFVHKAGLGSGNT